MRSRSASLVLLLAAALPACVIRSRSHIDVEFSFAAAEESSREETLDLDLGAGDRLVIQGATGDVSVAVAPAGVAPHLAARIRARGETPEQASELAGRTRIFAERSGHDLVVRIESEPFRTGGRNARITLPTTVAISAVVPSRIRLDVRTSSGDVTVAGPVADSRVESAYGRVKLDDAEGEVIAASSSGEVRVSRVRGPRVEARSSYGDLGVEDVAAGAIVAETSSGEVTLRGTKGPAEARSGYGKVDVKDHAGDLAASSSSGDVRVRGVRGENTPAARLSVESGYGKVTVEGVLASLTALSSSGNVEVAALPGSRVESDWTLRSGYGDVVLALPGDASFELDARTSYGEITSEFDLRVRAGKITGKTVEATVGDGGNAVRLSSSSGDVALRRAGGGG